VSLLRRPVESRTITEYPWSTASGTSIVTGSAESALRLIPLYAAVTGIADDISAMPWHGYQETSDGGGQRLAKEPELLRNPGVGIGRIGWFNQGTMSMLLRGFAFGVVVATDGVGNATRIVWVHPDRVSIDETGAIPIFRVNGRVIEQGTYVYIPAAVMPGSIVGLSPVTLFRLQFNKMISAQEYAQAFFRAGIMPPGVLRNSEKVLPDGAASLVKTQFKTAVAERDIFVTGKDWEWTALSVPDDDAKFLDTIQAGATEIAAIYRVSPEDIGGVTGSSMTYGTVELNELKRNRRALLPWVSRWEEALTALQPQGQYTKANMDALVRADLLTRYQAHDIALRIGLETNAEARSLEDKAPLTSDEMAEWQRLYGTSDATDPAAAEARATAELLQKIYLAVGPVITADEAREIATKGGANLTAPFTPIPKAASTEGRTP
jgi:HK97 family phage portal protein